MIRLKVSSVARVVIEAAPGLPPRPAVRNDCWDFDLGAPKGPRPCPFVGCKYNLYLDMQPSERDIKLNFPHLNPWQMAADRSCVLDIAEMGGQTLEEVGTSYNLTRERARQIEVGALFKIRRSREND